MLQLHHQPRHGLRCLYQHRRQPQPSRSAPALLPRGAVPETRPRPCSAGSCEQPDRFTAAASESNWLVNWCIDVDVVTPQAAAANVWTTIFGRAHAGADDACVFIVTGNDGQSQQIDLSEHDLDQLIADDRSFDSCGVRRTEQELTA